MDVHLEAIVGVGSLSVGGLADHQAKVLGRHAHGAVHNEVLGESLVLQVGAHLLDGSTFGAGESDADAVDLRSLFLDDLLHKRETKDGNIGKDGWLVSVNMWGGRLGIRQAQACPR